MQKRQYDFSQNFNALGTPPVVADLHAPYQATFSYYPDHKSTIIIQKFSDLFGIPRDTVAFGNGATEILFNLPQILPKGKVLILQPTFWEYRIANARAGNEIKGIALREDQDFEPNYKRLGSSLPHCVAVYLCHPNNPTSRLLDKDRVLALTKSHPSVYFVIDETYLPFRTDFAHHTFIKEVVVRKNIAVVISLSKIFSIPGIRAGFMVANKELIKTYRMYSIPYLSTSIAEIIIPKILGEKEYLKQTRRFYEKQREKVYLNFQQNFSPSLKVIRPDANFILVKIAKKSLVESIYRIFQRHRILVRRGDEFENLNNTWFRIVIKHDKDMGILYRAIASAVK